MSERSWAETDASAIPENAELQSVISQLTNPTRLFSQAAVLARPSPVPKIPGVYAWYF